MELSRYLHLNPVQIKKNAALPVKERLGKLIEYPWSSFPGYVFSKKRQDLVTYTEILGMMGCDDSSIGRTRYRNFVEDPVRRDKKLSIWDDLKGQMVLGDESYMKWVYDRFIDQEGLDIKEQPGINDLVVGPQTLSEIAKAVAATFGVDEEELYRRRASCREARSVFLELSSRYLGRKMRCAELGEKLGGISSAALCLNKKRLSDRMGKNESLRQVVEKITATWKGC